jgi:hypothetical protein
LGNRARSSLAARRWGGLRSEILRVADKSRRARSVEHIVAVDADALFAAVDALGANEAQRMTSWRCGLP